MWRSIIIKILFRVLEQKSRSSYYGINKKLLNNWLDQQYTDMGFREYFRLRDIELMKSMSVGVSTETYTLLLGEKLEIMKMLQKVEDAHKRAEKDRLQKQKEAERIKNRKNNSINKGRSHIIHN